MSECYCRASFQSPDLGQQENKFPSVLPSNYAISLDHKMNPEDAIDFSREAMKTCMLVGGPILVTSLLVGLIIGIIQTMTQVQDQTVSFVPKILILVAVIGICLPWLTERMTDFARLSFEKPMTQWSNSPPPTLFALSQAHNILILQNRF